VEHIAVRLEALRMADRQKGRAVRSTDALVLPNEIKEIKNSIQMLRNDVSSINTNSINTKGFQTGQLYVPLHLWFLVQPPSNEA
jgi:hypothetical protein